MKTLRVRFSEKDKQLITDKIENYYELLDKQCIEIFLPDDYKYIIVNEADEADICIIGVQHTNNDLLRKNEINIFLSLENLGCGRTHYQFHNKFGDSNNDMVDIYLHNHYSKAVINKHPVQIIPVVDCRIKYFKKIYEDYKDICNIPFEEKKFCLFASQNMLNNSKQQVGQLMSTLGKIDTMQQYPHLKKETCYNSIELLKVFNQYKFIICFENSNTDGYITEKIFNVFCARSIPIYNGAPNINDYVDKKSYIDFNVITQEEALNFIKKIKLISETKPIYDKIINERKINNNCSTIDYLKRFI